jgi:digeranylgeranylglycerophospholipid reductase
LTDPTKPILIIGAGLAGVSAAAEIAAHTQAPVTIIERLRVGSNHTTPMTFAEVPPEFGLEGCVIGRYQCFTFHSPLGGHSSHFFSDAPLVALDYARAAQTLLQRAQKQGNIQVVKGTASKLQRDGGGQWQLTLANGETLTGSLIIDASGRGLFSHKALGVPHPKEFSHCYGAVLSGAQVPDPSEAFFLAPFCEYGDGGGWLYPLDDGRVSVGYATLGTSAVLPSSIVMRRFKRMLAHFLPYAEWLEEAQWERPEVGSIPIYPLKRLVYDGLMLVGDAAGQATIWSCMGSAAALEAGQLAGKAAVAAIRKNDFSARTLRAYQRTWDRRHRRIYRNNAILGPVVWNMSAAEWNRQIPRVQTLTSAQMVERLRTNWPVPAWPIAVLLRAYDIAGQARRGLARRLSANQYG